MQRVKLLWENARFLLESIFTVSHVRTVGESRTKKYAKYLLVITIFSAAIAPTILTRYFGYGISPILTGSMRPYANPGDLFITRTTTAGNLKVGEVVVLREQVTGVLYSHRIVNIEKKANGLQISTKGDANKGIDPDFYQTVPSGQAARVIFRVRWVGRLMVYLSSASGRQTSFALLVMANVLFLFVYLFRKPLGELTGGRSKADIYKELYIEERKNTEQYREIIDHFYKPETIIIDEARDMERTK